MPHPPDQTHRPPRPRKAEPTAPPRKGGKPPSASAKPAPPRRGGPPRPAAPRRTFKPKPMSEGALYAAYHADPQWSRLQEAAQRALVLMSRTLLEALAAAGWQVVGNRRNDAPEYTFGFDNIWTLRSADGSRTVELSPESSYRNLLYIAPAQQRGEGRPELDRQALGNDKLMQQKAAVIARRVLDGMVTKEQTNEQDTPT